MTRTGDQWSPGTATGPRPDVTVLALCYALGITLGWRQPEPWVWPWLITIGISLAVSLVMGGHRPRAGRFLVFAAAIGLGAAWVTLQYHWAGPNDLAGRLGNEPALLRVRGVALEEPVLHDQATGSMARFDYRVPVTCFPMRVDARLDTSGEASPSTGEVLVRVEGAVAPFRAGDRIEALGFLQPVGPPHNPGEFDYQRYARSLGQAGILLVKSRALINTEPAQRTRMHSAWLRWREQLRRRATGWLLGGLPGTERGERDALLAALLLGQRSPALDGLGQAFTEVGLAHVLAISGLHLGVLIGFILLLARAGGAHRNWHGWLVMAVVLAYLVLVEVRLPVLRAAVMILVVAAGVVCSRRWRVSSLVALSGIGLLTWRPDQLFAPGFQLSFGVVLGLIHFAPAVRRRWFGQPDLAPVSSMQMAGEWLKSALAAAVTAWSIATPIVVYHFGFISPVGAPLSVLVLPVVAVLLVVGFVKMLLAVVLPSAALLIGAVLVVCADVLISIVRAVDALPGSVVHVTQPSALWAGFALLWVSVWGRHPDNWRRRRRLLWLCGLVIVAWAAWPMMPWLNRPRFRIDVLSVGEGTCLLVRSGGAAVMFDAGSSSDPNAGRDVIVPAIRKLGVRRLDAILISHGNLDHYSAVLEVVEAFGVDRVLVTPQFMVRAEEDSTGPVAFLLARLTDQYVMLEETAAGEVRGFGDSRWTWLHPPGEAVFERVNDTSMVIKVEAAGRSALLTGDIQETALEMVLADGADLSADVLELPHHGSFSPAAAALVERVNAGVVFQSSGRSRWLRDKWGGLPANTVRLITARDGACWVEVDENGMLTTGRYLDTDRD